MLITKTLKSHHHSRQPPRASVRVFTSCAAICVTLYACYTNRILVSHFGSSVPLKLFFSAEPVYRGKFSWFRTLLLVRRVVLFVTDIAIFGCWKTYFKCSINKIFSCGMRIASRLKISLTCLLGQYSRLNIYSRVRKMEKSDF